MPKSAGTFVRARIMLVTDDGEDAIAAAIMGLTEGAEGEGYHTQVRNLKSQVEFRFVKSESHLVKTPPTPEEIAAKARRDAIRAISRTLGREVSAEEYDQLLAKFGGK